MDPNETLRRLRGMTANTQGGIIRNAELRVVLDDFAEHFAALDSWLVRGGFLPSDWEKARDRK